MSWFSILPESAQFIETWAIRLFLLLGIIAIGPWLLLIVYDAILYIFRTVTYDIPIIGGRARNRPRPRAPSLTERPSGRPRTLSKIVPGVNAAVDEVGDGLKRRAERLDHKRDGINGTIDD